MNNNLEKRIKQIDAVCEWQDTGGIGFYLRSYSCIGCLFCGNEINQMDSRHCKKIDGKSKCG